MSNAVGLCSQMSSISWTWNACLRNINYKSWLNSANMGADQKGSESAIGIGIIVGWFWDEKIGYESKVVVGGVLLHCLCLVTTSQIQKHHYGSTLVVVVDVYSQ